MRINVDLRRFFVYRFYELPKNYLMHWIEIFKSLIQKLTILINKKTAQSDIWPTRDPRLEFLKEKFAFTPGFKIRGLI